MSGFEPLIGILLVISFSALVILFSLKRIRTKHPPVFRKIIAIQKLRRSIGLAVEDGTRIHVSLGSANLIDPSNTSALVGLSSLHRIGQLTSTSDLPPISTSGNGGLLILGQDVLSQISVETNTRELYDPQHAQMTGVTPFSYAVGTMEAMSDSGINANVFIGNFGPEAGLLCDASEGKQAFTLAASDSVTSQSIFYAMSDDTLIGEELFALPAYLAYHSTHQASLRVQDIFRVLVGIVLVTGSILKIFGLI
ncbi:MAG: hypothetical protein FD147_1083 [Chloroflexi bacterium]|nr:MAG: hypothetical protein FD147_1083 [Chloroflexota bacterium]